MSAAVAGNSINDLGAAALARLIASRELSAREVCAAYIARCEQTHKALNALVWTRFDAALREADAIDEKIARGESVGPLAGVPFTVKECFFVEGSPACMGLAKLKDDVAGETGLLVSRLQREDAVLLGKTNVPQLMLWHECDNPVYGRTNNPWHLERTPGGSTGGEAAIIAAGASALGLGNDLGGSIRIPATWCGIHGLMATSDRLSNSCAINNFAWLKAMVSCPGTLARQVADLDLVMRVLDDNTRGDVLDGNEEPWLDFRELDVSRLRIGGWNDDGNLSTSPGVHRAQREALEALQRVGATIVDFEAPSGREILTMYTKIIQGDGGAELRRLARGSSLDWRPDRILTVAGLGFASRAATVFALRMIGQSQIANLIAAGGRRSQALFTDAVACRDRMSAQISQQFQSQSLDAIICPVHSLPAPQHGKPIDLISAASYSFLPNLLGWPAGVVSTTTVREDEQTGRPKSRDRVLQQAAAVDAGSAGLPVGVQVIARPWREDIVLAVMAAIERALPRPQLPAAQLQAICSGGNPT